jgi:hypothetical protein
MRLIRVNLRAMVFLIAIAVWALSGLGGAGHAGADTACNRVASPTGNDGSAGTLTAPWRSANYMIEHLNPGETGCFRGGTYAFSQAFFNRSAVTVTSYPGETATLRGTLKIEPGAEAVTVSNLSLVGKGATNIGPFIFGNAAKFVNDDVTNEHTEICFVVGSADPSAPPTVGTVIEGSRIHGCGSSPSTNQDHGIYVANSDGLIVRENWIYENTDRGIQLYPEAMGTQIYDNVITDNGEGVIVSDGSSGNVIRNNVIANSHIRWNIEASNLHGTGNVFSENCVWSEVGGYYGTNGGIMPAGERGPGLTVTSNTVAQPQFQDASAANFTNSSPCLSAPLGTPSETSAPAVEVTLQPTTTQVPQGTPVTLKGTVSGAEHAQTESEPAAPVTIQVFKNHHWHKLTKAHVGKDGRYKVRRKIGRRVGGKKVHLRAKVASYGRSRSVTIRFRS